MLGELIGEFSPSARIFILELDAGRTERITFGRFGHAALLKTFCCRLCLGSELRTLIGRCTIATAGYHQGSRPLRIGEAEVQCRKSAHGQANDVRLVNFKCIEYRADVITGALL